MKISEHRMLTLKRIRDGQIVTDSKGQKSAKWLVKNGLVREMPNWTCFKITEFGIEQIM